MMVRLYGGVDAKTLAARTARCESRNMIVPPTNVLVLYRHEACRLQKGSYGAWRRSWKAEFKADPFSGVIYVFRSKRAQAG